VKSGSVDVTIAVGEMQIRCLRASRSASEEEKLLLRIQSENAAQLFASTGCDGEKIDCQASIIAPQTSNESAILKFGQV